MGGDRRDRAPGAVALRWAAVYTRGLPDAVRERRLAELASDVHDHTVAAAEAGVRAPGLAITWRAMRGVASDVIWRRQEKRAMREGRHLGQQSVLRSAWDVATHAWFAPFAVLVGIFDLLMGVAVVSETDGKMPGKVIGPVVTTVLAVLLFTGLRLRWKLHGVVDGPGAVTAGGLARSVRAWPLLTMSVLTLVLLVVGVSTGGPGVFFIGLALFAIYALLFGGRALVRALRSTKPSDKAWLADAFVILGTLPALAMFWMVLPALLALAVIAGVVGTGARRPAVSN